MQCQTANSSRRLHWTAAFQMLVAWASSPLICCPKQQQTLDVGVAKNDETGTVAKSVTNATCTTDASAVIPKTKEEEKKEKNVCWLQTAKELEMTCRKTFNGANAFTTPGVTICIPPLITDQPDVIGFNAWVNYLINIDENNIKPSEWWLRARGNYNNTVIKPVFFFWPKTSCEISMHLPSSETSVG